MTSTAFDDQFAACTPEEEEFLQERQAHDDEQASIKEREQRAEDEAVEAMAAQTGLGPNNSHLRNLYRRIKAGRIPGVVLGGAHE